MKVLFLDIDGVMNCRESLAAEAALGRSSSIRQRFHPPSVAALNRVLAETGAVIVVSSSWRFGRSSSALYEILHSRGVAPLTVWGKTQEYRREGAFFVDCKTRGQEIAAWLADHPEVESYVIFDDDSDAGFGVDVARFVQTDHENGGLTDAHATRAIAILGTPIQRTKP